MNKIKSIVTVILSVLILIANAAIGYPQGPPQEQAPATAAPEPLKTTITGRIVFMKSYGGYIVISETPHEEYKIINENDKILGDLAKKGKPVTIEGNFPRGAYLLFIEKINGKKYQGGQ